MRSHPRGRRRHPARVAALTAGATICATLVGIATLGSLPASAATVSPSAYPAVVPTVDNWTPASGTFTLGADSTIVVAASASQADAQTMAADLATIGAPAPQVRVGGTHGASDIFLAVDPSLPAEGYSLDVDDTGVTITGGSEDGVFYGTQTVEQMLAATAGHDTLAFGTINDDQPTQAQRGTMVDTARKYWSIASLEKVIRQLAWLKMNTFHWHLTDSEYFRLKLPGYEDLAAPKSYDLDDIHTIEAYAAKYHVAVIPEVDLPGHSTALTRVHPELRWDCASMNKYIGTDPDAGFTVDITKAANVAYVDGLVKAVAGAFSSPVIHLGGDETPKSSAQTACSELTDYQSDQGYASPEDVFTSYENHLDDVLHDAGKTMMMWGWWPQVGGTAVSVLPNTDIVIQAWLGDQSTFISKGYHVVVSDEHSLLYVVPKYAPGTASGTYIPNDSNLYSTYSAPAGSNVNGLEMVEWGDNAYQMPDAYPLSYMTRPLQVLAAVAWGSPRFSSYLDYESVADTIGDAPGNGGVEPGAQIAAGTPTGATGSGNAVDGSTSTTWTASSAGAEVGIDRGADDSDDVVAVRFLPNGASAANAGATIKGCTGPDTGCTTLATVDWTPTADWQTIPLSVTGSYRYLYFVGGAANKPTLAEVQFLEQPRTLTASVNAPATLTAGASGTASVALTSNKSTEPLQATVTLTAVDRLDNTSLQVGKAATVTVASSGTATASIDLAVPANATPGRYDVTANVVYAGADSARGTVRDTATLTVPYTSLTQAYNDVAVTDDDNTEPGDADGAQSSLSGTSLAAQGDGPGAVIATANGTYLAPWDLLGSPDNALASGQTIPLSGKADSVDLLVTGTYAPAANSVTVTYADGTSATTPVTILDWAPKTTPTLPNGTVTALTLGKTNADRGASVSRTVYLYSLAIPADSSKDLASITLPTGNAYSQAKGPAIHVFAVTTDAPSPSQSKLTTGDPVTFEADGPVIATPATTDAGTWAVTGRTVTFTPASGFTGTATLPYQSVDPNNGVSAVGGELDVTVQPKATTGGGTGTTGTGTTGTVPTPKQVASVKIVKHSFAKGAHPRVVVKVARLADGSFATGKVRILIHGKKVVVAKLKAKNHGKLVIRLPKAYRHAIRLKARYLGDATTAPATSSAVIYHLR